MTWILIIMILYPGRAASVESITFHSPQSCQVAKDYFTSQGDGINSPTIKTQCIMDADINQ